MTRNINAGLTSLNNSERFIGIPIEGKADLLYISASDIVMISQVEAMNTLTDIYYKSGTDTSTVQITHHTDASEVLAGEIWKTIWKINQRESDVTEELVSSIIITAVKTGCSICKDPKNIVIGPSGPIPVSDGIVVTLDIDGTKIYTLANGKDVGTKMTIVVGTAINTPAGTLTPALTNGAFASIEFNQAGQTVELMWAGVSGWVILSRGSGALATSTTVAGLTAIR